MKHVAFFLLAIVCATIYFSSCQQENDIATNPKEEFLTLNSFLNINDLNKQEKQTFYKAFSRLNIVESKDGYLKLIQKSGKEVNISENIYIFVSNIINKQNEMIKSKRSYVTRFGVWDNDTSTIEDKDYHTDNDCMIFVIETLLHEFGKDDITAEDIRNDLSKLGYYSKDKGTYGSCIESALGYYFNVTPTSDIDNFKYGPDDKDKYCVIGRYSIGNNTYDYHAGIVSWSYNGTISYTNKEWNDTIDDYVPTTRIFLPGNAILLYQLTLK